MNSSRQESGPLRQAAAVAAAAPEQGPFTYSLREIEDSLASTLDPQIPHTHTPAPTTTTTTTTHTHTYIHTYNIARDLPPRFPLHAPLHAILCRIVPVHGQSERTTRRQKEGRFFSPAAPPPMFVVFSHSASTPPPPQKTPLTSRPLLRLHAKTLLFGAVLSGRGGDR